MERKRYARRAALCRLSGMKAPDDIKDGGEAERRRTPGVAGYERINRAIPHLSLNSFAGFQQ